MRTSIDRNGTWLYRAGGLSALALGVAYIVIIGLYVRTGAPPSSVEARLAYLAGHTMAWWAILGLSVLTDFLFVPVALSLYVVLKEINRNLMLFATACVALFIVLDLAITWTNYATLITLSGKYAKAASEAQRAIVITAADYPYLVLESRLLFVYNTLVLAVGILMIGFVMMNGTFGKRIAYLGIAIGILGVVSVAGPVFVSALSVTIILTSALTAVWVVLVGYRLYRLGQQS